MRPPARPRRVAPVQPDRTRARPVPPPTAGPPAGPADDESAGATSDLPHDPAPDASREAREARAAGGVVMPRSWQPVRPPVVSSGSAARFAERAAMRRSLLRRRVIIGSVAGAVLVALSWLLLVSPVLALDLAEVELTGEGTVVDGAAVAAVVAPYADVPLPRLDTVALRREVLDVPGVRAAEVARVWPHGLRITVVSREPVAAVPQVEGGFALLDVEGVQVGRVDAPPEGLPVISVPADDPGARALTAVLTVLQQLPPELAAQIATASADSQDAVRFGLRDGAVVEWGSADRNALKVRVLQTLRSAEASRGAAVFDVSAPTLPITRS